MIIKSWSPAYSRGRDAIPLWTRFILVSFDTRKVDSRQNTVLRLNCHKEKSHKCECVWFAVYVSPVTWALRRCWSSLSSVWPTSATEKPIFSSSYMNWPSIPVQAMHAQHWPTHYTPQSLSLSLLLIISSTHHYPHCALPTGLLSGLPAPSFSPSCPSAHLAFLSLFQACEWDDSVCVSLCTLSDFSVCVLRGHGGGGGRGSGLRMWTRCLRTLIPPLSLGPDQCQSP